MLLFFSPVVVFGPSPSQILRSHSHIVPYVQCFLFYPVLVRGPNPSQILRSHRFTCLMFLFFSPVVVSGPPIT